MNDSVIGTLTTIGAVGSGLVGGVMLAFSTLVMGGLRQLPAPDGIRAMQRINAAAPRPLFMLVFVGTAIVALVIGVDAVIEPDAPAAGWRLAGSVAYLATILITGAYNIPRNVGLDAVDPDGPAAADRWRGYLASWLPGNHVRMLTAAAGSALLIIAAVRM